MGIVWQKSPGNWSHADKGKGSDIFKVLPMVGFSPGLVLVYSEGIKIPAELKTFDARQKILSWNDLGWKGP